MHRMWIPPIAALIVTIAFGQCFSEPPHSPEPAPKETDRPHALASPLKTAPPQKAVVPTKDPAQNAVIRDIMRLRNKHGDILSGTSLDTSPDSANSLTDGFQEALQGLANEKLRETHPKGPPPLAPSTDGQQFNSNSCSLSCSLRNLARQLDERAAELEDQQQYPPADRLRRLAKKMRREAREM